jgi:putative transposase
LYNAALEERREAWRHGVTIRYGDQSAQLTEIRRADPDGQGRWSFTSQQQTLRRLDRAFQGFFQRVRAGRRAGYPRFKTAARWDSVDFVDGDGARWRPGGQVGSGSLPRRRAGEGQGAPAGCRPGEDASAQA